MKVALQKALSLYLTGSANPASVWKADFDNCPYSKDELAELEINWKNPQDWYQFRNPLFNLHTDFESFPGYIRNAGLSVFDSLFSGIGAGFASKTDFMTGIELAGLAILTSAVSTVKSLPFLSTEYSLFDYGGKLTRSTLHIFDSIFSTIGEKGAGFTLPSIASGALSLLSLRRVLNGNNSEKFKMSIESPGGNLGRAAVHHMESMLSSKAVKFSNENQSLAAFLASGVTTLGFLSKDKTKKTNLPWESLEGMVSQTGFHFLDSIFSSIGTSFETLFDNPKNIFLGSIGFGTLAKALSAKKEIWDVQVPYPQFGGKLVRSVYSGVDALVFNIGSKLGNSIFGLPLSLGFAGLTYLTVASKKGKNLIKNFKVPLNTVGGLVKRLPFDLVYSMISAAGVKLSKLIPAPLLVLFGPALSFQLGEKFKHIDAKYDECKGIMVRNSVHLWESILASAAYRTGRLLTGTQNEHGSSGSVLADGRWLTEEGRIVPTMAIGKQEKHTNNKNLFNILLSSLGGIVLGIVTNIGLTQSSQSMALSAPFSQKARLQTSPSGTHRSGAIPLLTILRQRRKAKITI